MSAIALQPYYGATPFDGNYFQPTFFDEPERPKKRKGEFCRVYNDGGHFIAVPLNQRREKDTRRRRVESELREIFDALYCYTVKEGKSADETRAFLQDNLAHLFPDDTALNVFIEENTKRKLNNLHNRKKRFYRKANLNKWTHFITITYDGEKHTEQAFRAKLRKCLCNFHTRRGWKYMGVFERAPETGRLHFHALLYVPSGQMVGEITEKQDYSTKKHRMQTAHENSFFAETFGRNDFEELKPAMRRDCVGYILKYLEKTGERITYSRGIPAEMYMNVDKKDVITEMRDFVLKYVLFDDVIDWETDIQNYIAPQVRGYEPRYLC